MNRCRNFQRTWDVSKLEQESRQGSKDLFSGHEIRCGRNPEHTPFPVADAAIYTRRWETHKQFIKKSSDDVVKPKLFTADLKWKEWVTSLNDSLSRMAGREGVPLSYVIRPNEMADPTPDANFLVIYIRMYPMTREAFLFDNEEVKQVLRKYIDKNPGADQVLATINENAGGREIFLQLKEHYEGDGLMAMDLQEAKRTINNLFYAGEKPPQMTWIKFEAKLRAAYNVYENHPGHVSYSDYTPLSE